MSEQLTPAQIALNEARDNAEEAKLGLANRFTKAAMPVEAVSLVLDENGFGVAVHMSRRPTSAEIPELPKLYDGVGVQYFTRENGQTMKLKW